MSANPERRELLDFALELAGCAEREILPRFQNCRVRLKPDGSEVTEADERAEAAIRAAIAARYPEHRIWGEELGRSEAGSSSHEWVVDPIDGTTWFALGSPNFGTLVALLEDGDPTVGVIHLPALRETVFAARGLGCWFRDARGAVERVEVCSGAPLAEAVVSSSGVHGSEILPPPEGGGYTLTPILRHAARFRFCGDCLQHALVCRGRLHAALDTIMQPWDVAALVPCVEEAGGVVTTMAGTRDDVLTGGSLLSSCDAGLHAELLEILSSGTSEAVP